MADQNPETAPTVRNSITLEAIGRIADESENIIARLQNNPIDEEAHLTPSGRTAVVNHILCTK